MMHMNTTGAIVPTPARVAFGTVSIGAFQNARTHASI